MAKKSKDKWMLVDWSKSDEEIASELNRAVSTVRYKRYRLKPSRAKSRTIHEWKSLDWSKSDKEIAAETGCTVKTVKFKRSKIFSGFKGVEYGYTPQNLIKLIEYSELNQNEFCSKFSIAQSDIENFKRGTETMDWDEWQKLLDAVERHID